MARSTLLELFTRVIPVSKKDNIYQNGEDDNYPERIERIINNSVTAKMSANKLASYIYGKGFTDNPLVNKKKKLRLNDILSRIVESVKYHKGFYLHINYDIEGEVNYLDVLPYNKCRISKEDAVGYKGAIYYADEWNKRNFMFSTKSKKAKWFYPYNESKDVINAQRRKDNPDTELSAFVENFRGQVLFVNFEPQYIYPLAYIDPAYNDADSEYRTSIYKNTTLRNGFIGKMVATILKATDKKEKEAIENDLQNLLGAEESGNLIVYETENDSDGKLIEVVKFDEVKSNINDKLFQYTEESVIESILMSYSLHPSLVRTSHKLFGSSGLEMQEIKKEFQNSTEIERTTIEQVILQLYKKENKIIPLIEE